MVFGASRQKQSGSIVQNLAPIPSGALVILMAILTTMVGMREIRVHQLEKLVLKNQTCGKYTICMD